MLIAIKAFFIRCRAGCLLRGSRVMAFICLVFSVMTILGILYGACVVLIASDPAKYLGTSTTHRVGGAANVSFDFQSVATLRNKAGKVVETYRITDPRQIPPDPMCLWLLITQIPWIILVWALLQARYYFRRVSRSEFFDPRAAGNLRGFVLGSFAYIVMLPCIVEIPNLIVRLIDPRLAMHFTNVSSAVVVNLPYVGEIPISWLGILMCIFIGALAVVASVMGHASQLAEEHAQII
jgi:hypothetical protein